jgi:hypothetical protein
MAHVMSRVRLAHRRLPALLGVLGLVLLAMALSPARPVHAAPGYQLFVGYATQAGPTQFPMPWTGSPTVVFAGCQPGCSFDASAARVVNISTVTFTVDFVKIKFDTCTYDIWPHGTVLTAGRQLIVTQTGTTPVGGCAPGVGSIDGSDIGPGGVNWGGNCNQSGVIPEVDVSVNGVETVFLDTGQVLNTGGVDRSSCPAGTIESTQWTSVGSQPCRSSVFTLAPPTQTRVIGTTATVVVALDNSCGEALSGVPLDFAASSGATGHAVSALNGAALFSYTRATPGTDTVQASATNPIGTVTSGTVGVTWIKHPTALQVTGALGGHFHDPASVAAVLSDDQGPVNGAPITFTLNGVETCSATTDSTGTGFCSLTPGEAAGPYDLHVSFGGDATRQPSQADATFAVTLEDDTLTYTGPARAANGEPLTLSGLLQEDSPASTVPIAGRSVAFTIGSGGSAQSCSGTTGADGRVSCTVATVSQPASTTSLPVSAAFAGDTFYQPASATATLRFQFMTGRAFGLSASGLLVNVSPTPDTGPVSTAVTSTVAPPCVATISGLITAHTLCVQVVTGVNPGSSTATASVQDATIGVLGVPAITLGLIQSSSRTTCAGSSGQVTIASIAVGGVPVNVALHPAANTGITVAGVQLVLNEQQPVAGADQGLTVNAVHIVVPGVLDVLVASATSDIHNC